MNIVRAAALAWIVAPLLAQTPAQPGQTPPPGGAAKVDTEAVDRPETPEEKLQRLLDQVRKLEDELRFLKQIETGGGLIGSVKTRLKDRTLSPQQIDDPGAPKPGEAAPAPAPVQVPAPAQGKKARLLGDAEKKGLPEGTILTVDGLPVTEAEFQEVFTYLRAMPSGASEDDSKSQALGAVIKRKAAEAAFKDGAAAARDRMVKAQQQLKDGTDFAVVAQNMSDCPSKVKGGDLEIFFDRAGAMDMHFKIASFGLKDGETSKVVQTAFGYHLIKRTGTKKGANANDDQVRCSHILAMYGPDQFAVRNVEQRVNSGGFDIAFVSDDYRKLAPAVLR